MLVPQRISAVWVLEFCRAYPNEYEAKKMDEAWPRRFVTNNEMINSTARSFPDEGQ